MSDLSTISRRTLQVTPMAPQPTSKVIKSKAFTNTGPDYFGLLYIRHGKYRVKVWVCLFTCITVRAIHLELVEDMTAEQFLSALRRFITRRGKPDQIILDNAPDFKATKNAVDMAQEKVVDNPAVHSYLSDLKIKWPFVIELSPWMGGFYERLVGIIKKYWQSESNQLPVTTNINQN